MPPSSPSQSLLNFTKLTGAKRRLSREVTIGNLTLGGTHSIAIQSMLTTDTRDIDSCVTQALKLAEHGCQLIRLTAQTKKVAENLAFISKKLRKAGCHVPLVADIHFKPDAAMEAAKWVEKIRINPGNFIDKKKFQILEYSDAEYQQELETLFTAFSPLVKRCKELGRAMRIGANHGSLSDRIMNRYGDTPLGMVESALEFARIARACDYHNFIFSMKSSNPKVMIQAYRLLISCLEKEGSDWTYPIHLGVTEAGDREDGRVKSAIGIGSLLSDGIGDTIRVSLTEDPEFELPVAQKLVEITQNLPPTLSKLDWNRWPKSINPFEYTTRISTKLKFGKTLLGGNQTVRVFLSQAQADTLSDTDKTALGELVVEGIIEDLAIIAVDPTNLEAIAKINAKTTPQLVTVIDSISLGIIEAFRQLSHHLDTRHSILLKDTLHPQQALPLNSELLIASTAIGSLLCDGIGQAVWVRQANNALKAVNWSYLILQSASVRFFKANYIACPSCGRTLFDLQSTTQKVQAATQHLKGVSIAVMGCIVNGPGEMADSDFGYVGGAPNKINLYERKNPVKFNIPEKQAVNALIELIKEHGRWVEP